MGWLAWRKKREAALRSSGARLRSEAVLPATCRIVCGVKRRSPSQDGSTGVANGGTNHLDAGYSLSGLARVGPSYPRISAYRNPAGLNVSGVFCCLGA
jgi:hypothetical protein